MQSLRIPRVDRPQVAFRVGVSGARTLAPTEVDRVRAEALGVLKKIAEEVLRCSHSETARRVYKPGTSAVLRLITPLADGVDRLMAEEALRCHQFEIEVPLPFAQAAYEATFAKDPPEQHATSIAEFRALLRAAGSRVLTLDGNSLDDIDRRLSYEAVGRLVIRNCDLLIAVWDDEKVPRGRGGTTDIVHYALRVGVPVWWIHAAKHVAPKWLEDILDLPRAGRGGIAETQPDDLLRTYIAKAILPPAPIERAITGAWERSIVRIRQMIGIQTDPLLAFLDETGLPNRKYWNLYPSFIGLLRASGGRRHLRWATRSAGRPTAGEHEAPLPPTGPRKTDQAQGDPNPRGGWLGKRLLLLGEPFRRNRPGQASSVAAGLSGIYQHRYRSSYTLVFVCGALALICAVIGAVFRAEFWATPGELLMLGIILGFVIANQLGSWHERYISYRILGELIRMSRHLHGLAWALPASRVTNLAHSTRRSWVAWFFAANVRATPLVEGHFSQDELTEMKREVVENLIGNQLHFHDRRHKECDGAAHILGFWGRFFFFFTLVLVLIRIVSFLTNSGHEFERCLSLFCALLPAASAAIFGIRVYEELEVLAEQSAQMYEALSKAQTRIGRIAVDRSLASQLLGAELFDVAMIMLSDIAGWAQLFRMKAVEA
jgi:hypothetical protein